MVKIGRTHLMDAVPIRLGQEFSGYARQIELAIERIEATLPGLRELAIGGTAVGTGLNTHPEFGARMARELSDLTGTEFREAENHFEAQGSRDAYVFTAGALTALAAALMKIANDIRLLASGPQAGLGELVLPAIQPGSSIMPGKVNPVISEVVIQVGAQVTGNCQAITIGGQWGQLDLNVMLPMMARNMLESVRLLANASRVFVDKALAGLEANREQAESYIEGSISMATALNPLIGYDNAAKIAKKSHATGRTVRELAYEESGLTREQVDEALHPHRQTEPGTVGRRLTRWRSRELHAAFRTDSAAAMNSSTCCCSQMSGGRRRKVVGPAGRTRTPRSCRARSVGVTRSLSSTPIIMPRPRTWRTLGLSNAGEAIHQLRAERRGPRIEVALTQCAQGHDRGATGQRAGAERRAVGAARDRRRNGLGAHRQTDRESVGERFCGHQDVRNDA